MLLLWVAWTNLFVRDPLVKFKRTEDENQKVGISRIIEMVDSFPVLLFHWAIFCTDKQVCPCHQLYCLVKLAFIPYQVRNDQFEHLRYPGACGEAVNYKNI